MFHVEHCAGDVPRGTPWLGAIDVKVIAVVNQKGGVGKTTTAVNLAAGLALAERPTLLVDLDPQGNATTGLGIDKQALKRTIYHVLLEGRPIEESIQATALPSYVSSRRTSIWSAPRSSWSGSEERERRLRQRSNRSSTTTRSSSSTARLRSGFSRSTRSTPPTRSSFRSSASTTRSRVWPISSRR